MGAAGDSSHNGGRPWWAATAV